MFTDALISGVIFGCIYALIASGFSLSLGFTKMLNLAHGEILIFASYFCYFLFRLFSIDPFLSLLIILPVFFFIGFFLYKALLKYSTKSSPEGVLLLFIAISTILQNVGLLFWLPTQRSITLEYLASPIKFFGVSVPPAYLVGGIAGLMTIFLLHIFLTKTKTGIAIRTISQDPEIARTCGINVSFMGQISFGLAFLNCGLSGVMVALMFTFNPVSGINYLLIALTIVVLGGLGSIFGCLVGGIIIGIAGSIGAYFFGSGVHLLINYIVFLIMLLIRPKGLFGRYVL
ncbi:MAG: branched-chain amino acid ABC transporter permease [Candidatus Bathyarchaeia archaeon]